MTFLTTKIFLKAY